MGYFKRMAAVKLFLEMEIGITGGEEDGVDNTNVKADSLYTKPEQVFNVYKALSPISPMFSIAAAFGNVHGVYKAGNVVLSPTCCRGTTAEEIGEAVSNGVVKMNIDTDTQWAYLEGLKNFYEKNKGYLQGQIGNPDGADKPNKKFYD